MWKASEVVAGISDLCVSEFFAQLKQRDRLEGASVELNALPEFKVGGIQCVSIHMII